MKKLLCLCLAMLLFALPALAEKYVPASTSKLPDMLSAPDAPQIIRVQKSGDSVAITLDRELPRESLVTALGRDYNHQLANISMDPGGRVYTASGLPAGGYWMGFEIAWVDGNVNALARYNSAGGLEETVRYDSAFNEYIHDNDGQFCEFAYEGSGVRARFDSRGMLTSYGYKAVRNAVVWFSLQGEILFAEYDDGVIAAAWERSTGWYADTPFGREKVKLDVNVRGAQPLLKPDKNEEEEEVKVTHYPNNTICLAGLTLQEVSPRLPDKWYNVMPIDLTREGRQTYFLMISNMHYIGRCYVDVWDGTVTVSTDLIEHQDIQPLSSYGRWFTRLSEITKDSIESMEDGFVFGEPVDIEAELGGADAALLFIRSKATYRLPFRDGTTLTRYWRNKPDWKEFREGLQELLPLVEN